MSFPEQGRSVVLTVILSNKRGGEIEVFKNVISYKQALKFSEDPRSGLLTHTHTQKQREREKLTSRA